MRKCCFFDVDGTLLPKGSSNIPFSTAQALHALQGNGCGVVLCTGRSMTELSELNLLDFKYDGYVLLNGQLCLDGELKAFRSVPFDVGEKETVLELFNSFAMPVVLVERERLYMNYHDSFVAEAQKSISTPVHPIGYYAGDDIFMATVYGSEGSLDTLNLAGMKKKRWHQWAVDVYPQNGGKVAGIEAFLSNNDLTIDDAFAFGDAENDTEMLEYVGTGIAMGNAMDEVKAIADYVTTDDCDNGIANALKHFGLI